MLSTARHADPVTTEAAASAAPAAPLPARTLLIFGLPVVGVNFGVGMVGFYFLKFSTDVLLLAPATMGLVFGASRLWDAISDPLVGYWSDRTKTRLGRRRPWLLASALPVGVVFAALWAPPARLEGTALLVWTTTAVFLFYTAITTFFVPHAALAAELTRDYHDRTRVFTAATLCAAVGGILGLGVLSLLINSDVDHRTSLGWLAAAVGALTTLLIVCCALLIREPREHLGRGAASPYAAFRDVLGNPHARTLLLACFLQFLGIGCVITMVPYTAEYLMGDLAYLPRFLLAYAIPLLLTLPLWAPLSRRFGKRNTTVSARLLQAIAVLGFFFVREGELARILSLCAVIGVCEGAASVLLGSLKADVIDWDEWRTGERKEGAYSAGWNLAFKSALAFGVGIVGLGLDAAGFQPGVAQTPQTKLAMLVLTSLVPAALLLAGGALLIAFRLGEREHAALRHGTTRDEEGVHT